jgi:hypothetical protein
VSNIASGAAGFLSVAVLSVDENSNILGMDVVAMVSQIGTKEAPSITQEWITEAR